MRLKSWWSSLRWGSDGAGAIGAGGTMVSSIDFLLPLPEASAWTSGSVYEIARAKADFYDRREWDVLRMVARKP